MPRAMARTAATGGGPVASVQRSKTVQPDPVSRRTAVVTTAEPPQKQDTPRTTWTVAAIVVVALVFGLILVWSVVSGAIKHAYNDDWGYLRIAQNFVDNGRL